MRLLGITDRNDYHYGHRVKYLAALVALRHHDIAGSIPGLGVFNIIKMTPNMGLELRTLR